MGFQTQGTRKKKREEFGGLRLKTSLKNQVNWSAWAWSKQKSYIQDIFREEYAETTGKDHEAFVQTSPNDIDLLYIYIWSTFETFLLYRCFPHDRCSTHVQLAASPRDCRAVVPKTLGFTKWVNVSSHFIHEGVTLPETNITP